MKRIGLGLSLACACALAGVFAAFALADDPPPPTTTTATTTTTTTTPAQTLAEGVSIGGVPVGGLTLADARSAILDSFSMSLRLEVGTSSVDAAPARLAAPNVKDALRRAATAPPNTNVKLVVVVRAHELHAYMAVLAKKLDTAPVDSTLLLRNLRPFLTKERPGRVLLRAWAEHAIAGALVHNTRDPLTLRANPVAPKVTRKSFGPVIVIHRGSNRLFLFRGMGFWHLFPVATGQTTYPTPLGRFQIVVKWKDPWWYPPNSPWAQGEKPVPPGPSNPLGPRWMGLSAPGVGIHGTNNESSIGYSVSHGCIRMHVVDAEWLFDHVDIGTTVYIVGAA
jgi:lipoprotein-anchoring transpeptidase ErfK/SrfK